MKKILTEVKYAIEVANRLRRNVELHNPGRGIEDPPALPFLVADCGELVTIFNSLRIDIVRAYEKKQNPLNQNCFDKVK